MFWLQLIVGIIIIYILLIWVVARLITPHLGFRKEKIPETISFELQHAIDRINAQTTNKREFLEKAYDYVVSRYYGARLKTITDLDRAYGDILNKTDGFLPCTGQNFMIRTMLVKSGKFSDEEITVKTVPLNFFIHQYLDVYVDGQWIHVDPWSHFKGLKLGERSIFFG